MIADQAVVTAEEVDRSGPIGAAGRGVRPLLPVLALYGLYTVIRFILADSGPQIGMRHAESLYSLERRLHLDWEHGLQSFALAHDWLIMAANWYYVLGFLPALIGAALLAAWRAPETFAWWRNAFMASLLIALVGYALYPLTPPRLAPADWGFVDTLRAHGPHYYGDATGRSLFNAYGSLPTLVNVHAAMPSMHVAWSVVAGALFAGAFGFRPWAMLAGVFHPLAMAFAVLVTGNHFLLDIVAGLFVLALAMILAGAFERLRARLLAPRGGSGVG